MNDEQPKVPSDEQQGLVPGEPVAKSCRVRDSAFEGWFAENYRKLGITSKRAARDTYAAGMEDENVLSELQANNSIIGGQERRIAQLESDIAAIEADILQCSRDEAEREAQRIAIDVYNSRKAMRGCDWALLSSLIRLAAAPASPVVPAHQLHIAASSALDTFAMICSYCDSTDIGPTVIEEIGSACDMLRAALAAPASPSVAQAEPSERAAPLVANEEQPVKANPERVKMERAAGYWQALTHAISTRGATLEIVEHRGRRGWDCTFGNTTARARTSPESALHSAIMLEFDGNVPDSFGLPKSTATPLVSADLSDRAGAGGAKS